MTLNIAALVGLLILAINVNAATPRIIDGSEVSQNDQDTHYPWITSLYIQERASCGASLIASQWVLTAAHCVTDEDSGAVMSSDSFSVVVNDYDLANATDGESRLVSEVHVAAGYDTITLDNDIAILKLSTKVSARPLMLINSDSFNTLTQGTPLTVMGWGNTSTSGNNYPNILRETHLNFASFETCKETYSTIGQALTLNMFCAGGNGDTDACQGDSGGPIVRKVEGTYLQVGIVSWGGTQTQSCAVKDYPGVFTNLSRYSSWIASVIADNEMNDASDTNDSPDTDNNNPGPVKKKSSAGSLGYLLLMLTAGLFIRRHHRAEA
jgi:secreted trypsin-like serine protease